MKEIFRSIGDDIIWFAALMTAICSMGLIIVPRVRDLITWISSVHTTLSTIDQRISRIETIQRHHQMTSDRAVCEITSDGEMIWASRALCDALGVTGIGDGWQVTIAGAWGDVWPAPGNAGHASIPVITRRGAGTLRLTRLPDGWFGWLQTQS